MSVIPFEIKEKYPQIKTRLYQNNFLIQNPPFGGDINLNFYESYMLNHAIDPLNKEIRACNDFAFLSQLQQIHPESALFYELISITRTVLAFSIPNFVPSVSAQAITQATRKIFKQFQADIIRAYADESKDFLAAALCAMEQVHQLSDRVNELKQLYNLSCNNETEMAHANPRVL